MAGHANDEAAMSVGRSFLHRWILENATDPGRDPGAMRLPSFDVHEQVKS